MHASFGKTRLVILQTILWIDPSDNSLASLGALSARSKRISCQRWKTRQCLFWRNSRGHGDLLRRSWRQAHARRRDADSRCFGLLRLAGFIDAHTHIGHYARRYENLQSFLPYGTTALVASCDEMSTVFGYRGLQLLWRKSNAIRCGFTHWFPWRRRRTRLFAIPQP